MNEKSSWVLKCLRKSIELFLYTVLVESSYDYEILITVCITKDNEANRSIIEEK